MPKKRKQQRYSIALPGLPTPQLVSAREFHQHVASGHLDQIGSRSARLKAGREFKIVGDYSVAIWTPEVVRMKTNSATVEHRFMYAHNGLVPLVQGFRGVVKKLFHKYLAARIIQFVELRQREWAIELDCALPSVEFYRELVRRIMDSFVEFQGTLPEGYRKDYPTLTKIWHLLVTYFAPTSAIRATA